MTSAEAIDRRLDKATIDAAKRFRTCLSKSFRASVLWSLRETGFLDSKPSALDFVLRRDLSTERKNDWRIIIGYSRLFPNIWSTIFFGFFRLIFCFGWIRRPGRSLGSEWSSSQPCIGSLRLSGANRAATSQLPPLFLREPHFSSPFGPVLFKWGLYLTVFGRWIVARATSPPCPDISFPFCYDQPWSVPASFRPGIPMDGRFL